MAFLQTPFPELEGKPGLLLQEPEDTPDAQGFVDFFAGVLGLTFSLPLCPLPHVLHRQGTSKAFLSGPLSTQEKAKRIDLGVKTWSLLSVSLLTHSH